MIKHTVFIIIVVILGVVLNVVQETYAGSCIPEEGEELYRGNVLFVVRTLSEFVVQNISDAPAAIRVSWDKQDPHGKGDGFFYYYSRS